MGFGLTAYGLAEIRYAKILFVMPPDNHILMRFIRMKQTRIAVLLVASCIFALNAFAQDEAPTDAEGCKGLTFDHPHARKFDTQLREQKRAQAVVAWLTSHQLRAANPNLSGNRGAIKFDPVRGAD